MTDRLAAYLGFLLNLDAANTHFLWLLSNMKMHGQVYNLQLRLIMSFQLFELSAAVA